nr:glycosyltransferase family 4 protein [Nitrospirota bacterium]
MGDPSCQGGRRTVVHIITRLDRGGSARNTLLTAVGHTRSLFEPVVVTGLPGRHVAQGGAQAVRLNCRRLEEANVRWCLVPALTTDLNPIKDFHALVLLIKLLRKERPAIVHTHTSKAGVLGRLAAWFTRVPVVVHTPHGHVFYGHFGRIRAWIFLQIERMLAIHTTWMIGLTESERSDHLCRGVGRAERFAVVPSGIDLNLFRQNNAGKARPEGFDVPPDAVVAGTVGWLTPIKGHRYLIEALAALREAHPRLHVVIVGSGELREGLTQLAARLGVGDRVLFLGERDDVPACLAAMHLFVLPSLNEGMGRALVEAMAAGLPVIATRVGGVPAIVEDRMTGRLVPPGDSLALAGALDELLRHPDQARTLGVAATRRIDASFGIPAMVQAVETLYEEALREWGGG